MILIFMEGEGDEIKSKQASKRTLHRQSINIINQGYENRIPPLESIRHFVG